MSFAKNVLVIFWCFSCVLNGIGTVVCFLNNMHDIAHYFLPLLLFSLLNLGLLIAAFDGKDI